MSAALHLVGAVGCTPPEPPPTAAILGLFVGIVVMCLLLDVWELRT